MNFVIAPSAVLDALEHVRQHHPEVMQVFYGVDRRWLFCGEAFESPTFGPEIDTSLLEAAADAVECFPVAFAMMEPEVEPC